MDWIQIVVLVLVINIVSVDCVWWAATRHLVLEPGKICRKTRRLRGKQAHICKKEPDVVRAVSKGVALGLSECHHQFRNRRWNCTTSRRSLKKIIFKDTRETGFVNAITAAGVTYQITHACTQGSLHDCPCDRTHGKPPMKGASPQATSFSGKGMVNLANIQGSGVWGSTSGSAVSEATSAATNTEWGWGGCGDNVHYGYIKAKEFLEERFRKKSDVKTMVLKHNYEAGRLAVYNYMRTVCKCHGMSGSCTVKSCWRKLPIFRDVGNRIKDRFDGAAKVTSGNDGKSFIPDGGSTIKPPDSEDIVYSEESPDFCVSNSTTGSLGTTGRLCNYTSMGVEGCELLCCGRGFTTTRITEKYNCACRFEYCCDVQCEECTRRIMISKCL